MDVNTFYELKTRLYAAAAAGCGLITEDFRLKRALEAFKPMSEANKVFGRLYQMCENLFTTDNVAGELVDCIALADALAVTQGSFLDKSECVKTEEELNLKPQAILHSSVQELKNKLGKNDFYSYYTQKDIHRILDPRIFLIFIQSLQLGYEDLEDMADILLPPLKGSIRELLKKQVDFKDTSAKNKTAYYVRLICRLYGDQENDWYLHLVEEESYPKSIRVAAVHALGCSEKNVPKLLELYKTQKGDAKKAVTLVLAKLNPPEAEDIWEKMVHKYRDSYEQYIIQSKSDICAQFVKESFDKIMKHCEECYQRKKKTDETKIQIYINWLMGTMHRKLQLEECFFKFAENYPFIKEVDTYYDRREDINQVLINNLLEEDVQYAELIKRLYKKHKEFYFPARFFLALKENGESAFETYNEEIHNDRKTILKMLGGINYSYVQNSYCLYWYGLGNCTSVRDAMVQLMDGKGQTLYLFDTIPEHVISFLTETDYFSSQNKDGIDETAIRYTINVFDLEMHGLKPGTKEYEKCREIAVKFALKVNIMYSVGEEITRIILPYYEEITTEEYVEVMVNCEVQDLLRGNATGWGIDRIDGDAMPIEDKKKALMELKNTIEKMDKADKKTRDKLLSKIEGILKTKYSE
ncbi:MAG: hypothetical protein K2I10_04030 [Lachnospiraceae bacterium]|nr:hypothetical protein [Lachnospiraceae bacterium]